MHHDPRDLRLICLVKKIRIYSADTQTMNARALFSLYLYFFFTYFNIFSELANHSRESIQQPRLFSCLFSTLFFEPLLRDIFTRT